MKKINILLIIIGIIFVMPSRSWCAEYYVSTTGNNSYPGTIGQPWKTINYGQSRLSPGDTLLVRGGIYYESVTITVRGAVGKPITLKAYPGEKPILDGNEPITGWTQCGPNEAFLTVQGVVNPSYANIYKAKIPRVDLPADMRTPALIFFEGGVRMFISRTPQNLYPTGVRTSTWHTVPLEGLNQRSYIQDSGAGRPPTKADDYWAGAWIDVYMDASYNNRVVHREVRENKNNRIEFTEDLPANMLAGDRYSMKNHPHLITNPGEFYITPVEDNNGDVTLYVYPYKDLNNDFSVLQDRLDYLTENIAMGAKTRGIWAQSNYPGTTMEYIIIDGFQVRGYQEGGITFTSIGEADTSGHIIVRNCTVTHCGWNGIFFDGDLPDSIIEDCTVRWVGLRGIQIVNGNRITIQRCTVSETISTNITITGPRVKYVRILHNTLLGSDGNHGNALTMYQGSYRMLVAYNYFSTNDFTRSNTIAIAYANYAKDGVIFANVFKGGHGVDQRNLEPNTLSWGVQFFVNNTSDVGYQNRAQNTAIDKWVICNNFVGGNGFVASIPADIYDDDIIGTHNVWPSPKGGWLAQWSMQTGDVNGRLLDYDALFVDRADGNYQLASGDNPMIGGGRDLMPLLIEYGVVDPDDDNNSWFPGFDFTKDKAGNTWAATPSIGAYEYGYGSPPQDNPNSNNQDNPINPSDIPEITELKVLNNVMKGVGGQATVKLMLAEPGDASVKIYDSKGKEVVTLWDGYKDAGSYDLIWAGVNSSGSKVGSGVYMVYMKAGSYKETKKIVVVK